MPSLPHSPAATSFSAARIPCSPAAPGPTSPTSLRRTSTSARSSSRAPLCHHRPRPRLRPPLHIHRLHPLPASPSSHSPLPPPLPSFITTPPPPPPPPPIPLSLIHPSSPYSSPLVTPPPFTHTSGFIALIVIVAALALALLCGLALWLFRRWRRSALASKEPLTEQEIIDMLRARGLARLQQRDWRAAHQQPVAPEAPAWRHTQQFAPAYEPSAPSLMPVRHERLQSPGESARFRPSARPR